MCVKDYALRVERHADKSYVSENVSNCRRMTTSTHNLSEIPAVPHDSFVDRGRQFRGQRSATDINMVTRRSSRASSYQKNNDFRQDREV